MQMSTNPSHQLPSTMVGGNYLCSFSSHRTCMPCSHQVNHELQILVMLHHCISLGVSSLCGKQYHFPFLLQRTVGPVQPFYLANLIESVKIHSVIFTCFIQNCWDNDPKHSSKPATEWLKKKKKSKGKNQGVATAQIPDLNHSEILSREPKGAVHKQLSAIFNELKHCCKEQRAQIPPQ